MNNGYGEVDEIVPVRSDVECAFKALIGPLGHAAYFNLIRLMHQAF